MGAIKILMGHTAPLVCVLPHPDSKRIVTGSHDSTIRIWDLDSGECLKILQGHTGKIRTVTLHPDGNRLISASEDNTFKIWDMDSGACLGSINMISKTWLVDDSLISPDGNFLISWHNLSPKIRFWDLKSFECAKTLGGHTNGIREVVLHPDNKRLISWVQFEEDDSVRIWHINSGACLQALDKHITSVEGINLFPDGRRLAVWNRDPDYDDKSPPDDPVGLVWDIDANKTMFRVEGHKDLIYNISPCADGDRVISIGSDGSVIIWDGQTGDKIRDLRFDGLRLATIHPDGKRLVVWKEASAIEIWDIKSGECHHVLKHPNKLEWYDFVPHSNDHILVSCCDAHELYVWDIDEGKLLHILTGYPVDYYNCFSLHPDGQHVLSCGGDIRLWDLKTGACLDIMDAHKDRISGYLLHPDGTRVISWSDNTIVAWKLDI